MQLVDRLRARRLMEPVDVLRHHRRENAAPFQLCERIVPRIRLCCEVDKAPPVEVEEFLRMRHEEAVRCHLLGGELSVQRLAVDAARAAKVGNARLCRHARPAEEHRVAASCEDFSETIDLLHRVPPCLRKR